MFFRRKPQENKKELNPEQVKNMIDEGMSDKDIIKNLKGQGYSYEEIEGSMLSAVKSGVQEPRQPDQPQLNQAPLEPSPEFTQEPAPPEAQEQLPDISDFNNPDNLGNISDMDINDISPETIVEELVEGVVEDKWKRFDDNIDKVKSEIGNLKEAMRNLEERPSEKLDMTNYDDKVKELGTKVNDISIRVGGLEKAFKQFLPSLTNNIENLSNIIKEMKNENK